MKKHCKGCIHRSNTISPRVFLKAYKPHDWCTLFNNTTKASLKGCVKENAKRVLQQ